MCLNLVSCLAINYETGLCVAFNSSASQHPDSLVVSEFPVFTMYAEKICLPTTDAQLEGFEEAVISVRDVGECRTGAETRRHFYADLLTSTLLPGPAPSPLLAATAPPPPPCSTTTPAPSTWSPPVLRILLEFVTSSQCVEES